MSDTLSEFVDFIGRLHPMLVHLPIGFILLLAVFELLARSAKFHHLRAVSRTLIVLSFAAATVSAACGWVLAWNSDGDYDAQALGWHKWFGTAVPVAMAGVWGLHAMGRLYAYRILLFLSAVLLSVAGHFGGSLTHGSDYLTLDFHPKPARSKKHKPVVPAGGDLLTLPAYAGIAQPILEQYCVSCHGPQKSKGKLRLDSMEEILRGGDSGAVLEADNPAQSLLIKRMLLPLKDEDHMPPEGKRQPSADEIALLQWWVSVGAPADKTIQELQPPENIVAILRKNLGTKATTEEKLPAPASKTE